jgi:geranylgeranyl diphosphate synthase type II
MRTRIEKALSAAIARAEEGAPPRLAAALRHAVFPGGARIRPRLCLAVAEACGADAPGLADAAASALELLHCASLVHDDLPCFDDAAVRRGRPSVHRAFGEPLAVLAGDALIVAAFETVALAGAGQADRALALSLAIARAVGTPNGLVAGQAWESEPSVSLEHYHRTKTGSLFTAATTCGALVAGRDPAPWFTMGERLGASYQVADDLLDALTPAEEAGKPVGQDASFARPNAVAILGVDGAVAKLRSLVAEAATSVPEGPRAPHLRALILQMAQRLVPAGLKQTAA